MDRRHSRRDKIQLILPTAQLFDEYKPVEHVFELLQGDGYTLESIAEFVFGQWAALQTEWHLLHRMPTTLTPFEKIVNFLYTDFLSERQTAHLDALDRLALRKVTTQFAGEIYHKVVPLVEEFSLTDYQMETLEVGPWVGRSMVIIINL